MQKAAKYAVTHTHTHTHTHGGGEGGYTKLLNNTQSNQLSCMLQYYGHTCTKTHKYVTSPITQENIIKTTREGRPELAKLEKGLNFE